MNVWRSGTSVCSAASARTCSRLGPTSRPSVSAATLTELLERVLERQAARGQEDAEVVEDVGRLLAHARVGLLARRARDLLGLFAHLLADLAWIGEQPCGVAGLRVRPPPLGDGPLERGKRLVRSERHVTREEARALAGVARGARRLDEREQGVGVAVVTEGLDALDVAGRAALVPELLARAAPEPRLARLARARERVRVHVRMHKDLARA